MYSLMKKTVLATAISASLLTCSSVYASGIPTIDLGAIAKMAEQIVEMKKSYDMLKAQFEQAVEMTKNLKASLALVTLFDQTSLKRFSLKCLKLLRL